MFLQDEYAAQNSHRLSAYAPIYIDFNAFKKLSQHLASPIF
jgi:hypothetical protein